MPYKNDNLDALFQKAASDYPLKTDSSDWESLSLKLNNSRIIISGKNKVWKYALIFLLLGGSVLVFYKYQNDAEITAKQQPNSHQNITQQRDEISKSSQADELSKTDNSSNSKTDIVKTIRLKDFRSIQNQSLPLINNNVTADMSQENARSQFQPDKAEITNNATNAENITDKEQKPGELTESNLTDSKNYTPAIDNTAGKNSNKAAKQAISLKPAYKIYGSVFGGVEFSTVKLQHVDKPGYRIGVALGYRINKRFNIEIGLQRELINFYSDGKYIDTSMLKIKPKIAIESVVASSKLTSVPITLRYNFLSKKNGHFFVTGGVNAIVITHSEQYEYSVSKNGVEGNLSKYYSSITSPKYFTGVSASAGYETKLSKLCNIKFEPYYQAPISDFGAGKLPVSNFGLSVGIVKDLK